MMNQTSSRNDQLAALAVGYISRFIGLPYHWGGNDPMEGFDCSNLACEMLRAVGKLGPYAYLTANQLFKKFGKPHLVLTEPKQGALVFYGREGRATHVGICYHMDLMIEAGDGRRSVDTESEASKYNAFMKIRPVDRRDDLLGIYDPFKAQKLQEAES